MPNKYTLKYCEKPQDYVEMYKVARSCMSIFKEKTSKVGWQIWQRKHLWPSILYYYIPDVKGVILKKDGKGICRRFIYKDALKAGPIYGAEGQPGWYDYTFNPPMLKGAGPDYHKIFNELLEKDGVKETQIGQIKIKPFSIPQVTFNKKPYCPLPHLDIIRKPFFISYDAQEKEFLFDPKKGEHKVSDTYEYSLWLTYGLTDTDQNV